MKRILASIALWFWAATAAVAGVPCTVPFNLQNGTTADATQVMANYNALITCLGNAAAAGANNDITSLLALSTPISPIAGGSTIFMGGTSTGSANAQVIATTVPTGFALSASSRVTFIAGFTNTAATQINVNSTGLTNLYRMSPSGPQALTGGEVVAGNLVEAIYDGTQFELVTQHTQFGGFGAPATIASAATTDLGTAGTHAVSVSGTTGITAFGSTASTTFPIYLVQFQGSLTLTNNNTSLILPNSTTIITAANDYLLAQYLGSGNWRVVAYFRASGQPLYTNPTFIQNYISGLTLSTAGSSATFGIAAGVANDSTNVSSMVLASAYTKTTASWALGTGNGCLDTGAIAINTWYTVFEIQRPDTGVVDILCSLSASAPTFPSNYTLLRRIGGMKTNGSSQWTKFFQISNEFIWDVPANDVSGSGSYAGGTNAISVPPGVNILARLVLNCRNTGGAEVLVSPTFITGAGVSSTNAVCNSASGGTFDTPTTASVMTDTSRQVKISVSTGSNWTFNLATSGWLDYRGQQ